MNERTNALSIFFQESKKDGSGNEDKGGPPDGGGGSGGGGSGGSGGSGDPKKDGKKMTPGPPSANAMRILVLAQKGDWTACESALKALERSSLDDGGPKQPLANISDNVSITKHFFF